jgi:hypothetical protein
MKLMSMRSLLLMTALCSGLLVSCQSSNETQGSGSSESPAADLEATFHFDHIFGDGELPAEDELNVGALGFPPLSALANGSSLKADWATLKLKLDPKDFKVLEKALVGLGHVGEGHCRSELVTS